MKRADDRPDERRVRELLRTLAEAVPPPADEEVVRDARAAAAAGRDAVAGGRTRRSSLPRRALLLALLLALAAAGGVGIGRSTAPAEGAAGPGAPMVPSVAPGFRPAEGWETAAADAGAPGVLAAVAATVPLGARGPLGPVPASLLGSMPADGIVVVASVRAATERRRAELRSRPLRLADAAPATLWQGPAGAERALADYTLRTARGPYELEVRVFVGTDRPGARLLAAAQAQVDRLVLHAAGDRVTLGARPAVRAGLEPVTFFGAVTSGRAGELVTVELKECGQRHFRVVSGTTTTSGGSWSTSTYRVEMNAVARARWQEATSPEVVLLVRPTVRLYKRGSRYRVGVGAVHSFWGKRVAIERLDRATRRWVRLRTVRLTEGEAHWNVGRFMARLPRGLVLRAVLPQAEARPCYVAGISNTLRT